MNRGELDTEIKRLENELKTAGKIHGRDLRKRIHRLKRERIIYDKYHEGWLSSDAKASSPNGYHLTA